MHVKLVVAKGKAKCREIPLPPTIFVIGRGSQCHLRPHCSRVSKLHCAIARWAADDLRSTNAQIEYLLRRALSDSGRMPGGAKPIPRRGRPPKNEEHEEHQENED